MERLKKVLLPLDYQLIEDNYKGFPINWDMVESFIYDLDLTRITHKSPYIRKVIMSELDKGSFKEEVSIKPKIGERVTYTMIKRWQDLKTKGVALDDGANYMISELCEELLNSYNVPLKSIVETNDDIMLKMNSGDTTKKFYALLRISSIVKSSGLNIIQWEKEKMPEMKKYLKDWGNL